MKRLSVNTHYNLLQTLIWWCQVKDHANKKLAHNLGTFIGMKQLRVLQPIITYPSPQLAGAS